LVIDSRDVARLTLEDLEREDPPLVERLAQAHRDMQRQPWPADRTCLGCLS
jgi:hypothetical protein